LAAFDVCEGCAAAIRGFFSNSLPVDKGLTRVAPDSGQNRTPQGRVRPISPQLFLQTWTAPPPPTTLYRYGVLVWLSPSQDSPTFHALKASSTFFTFLRLLSTKVFSPLVWCKGMSECTLFCPLLPLRQVLEVSSVFFYLFTRRSCSCGSRGGPSVSRVTLPSGFRHITRVKPMFVVTA